MMFPCQPGKCAIAAVCLLILSTMGRQVSGEPLDPVISHMDKIANVTVVFDSTTENDPPEGMISLQGEAKGALKGIVSITHETFNFRRDRARFESVMDEKLLADAAKTKTPLIQREIECITPNRVESMTVQSNDPEPLGSIHNKVAKKALALRTIDLALGLRNVARDDWKFADELKKGRISTTSDGFVEVRLDLEGGDVGTWRFDPKADYALRAFSTANPKYPDVLKIECDDFRKCGETVLPFKITQSAIWQDETTKKMRTVQKTVLTVSKATVGAKANENDETFMIVWPPHTPLVDDRVKSQLLTGDKARILTDQDIANMLRSTPTTKPAQTTGTMPAGG